MGRCTHGLGRQWAKVTMAEAEFSSRDFRDAMGCFATGIAVISAVGPGGEPVGMTVNSFASVSLDPPLVLYSLAKTASRFDAFIAARRFVVNVLDQAHQPVSNKFATKGVTAWDDGEVEALSDGCPVLRDALAVFECSTETQYEGGDHIIIVGRVSRVRHNPGGTPLLYYRGGYNRIAAG